MEKLHGSKLAVLTGGPCGGKSTVVSRLKREIEDRGGSVLVQPEAATHFFSEKGVQLGEKKLDPSKFQKHLTPYQLDAEKRIMDIANDYTDQVIVILDRSALDSLAYMDEGEFDEIIESCGITRDELLSGNRYDVIVDMVTAADGAEEFYTLENNEARSESPEEARELERKIQQAYSGAANFHIVDNTSDFSTKIQRVEDAILQILGFETLRSQRTFLVKVKDYGELERISKQIYIEQKYLENDNNREQRIRARTIGGATCYSHTLKTSQGGESRDVLESIISQSEYFQLSQRATRQVTKLRYTIPYNNMALELDKFAKGGSKLKKDELLCQANIFDDQQEIELPGFLEIVKEVSDDLDYRNYALSE